MRNYHTFSVEISEVESEEKSMNEYMDELEEIFKRVCREGWSYRIIPWKTFKLNYTAINDQLSDFDRTIITPADRRRIRNLCEFRSKVVSQKQGRSKDRAAFFCAVAAVFSGLLALDFFENIIDEPCLIIVAILLLVSLSLVIYWQIDCNKEAFYKLVADFLQDDGDDDRKKIDEIQSKPSKKYRVHVRS